MIGSEGYNLTSGGLAIVNFASRIRKVCLTVNCATMELNNSDTPAARVERRVELPVYEIMDEQRDSKTVIKFCLLFSAILISGLLVCLWA